MQQWIGSRNEKKRVSGIIKTVGLFQSEKMRTSLTTPLPPVPFSLSTNRQPIATLHTGHASGLGFMV